MNALRLFLGALALAGCASTPKSTLRENLPPRAPNATRIPVTFIAQESYMCGPTILKMAGDRHRPGVPLEAYKMTTFTSQANGTFKPDMLSASRRLGLAPYQVPNMRTAIDLIAQGEPVIVFQNLGLSWWPKGHYSLLVGYNAENDAFDVHSDTVAYQTKNYSEIVRTWKLGGEWAYVMVSPNVLPFHATFEEAFDNALLFEKLKRTDDAKSLYLAIKGRWPLRFEPRLALANHFHSSGRSELAIVELHKALVLHPREPSLLFNLAYLYRQMGNEERFLRIKEKLFAAVPEDKRIAYEKRLGN